MPAIKPSEVIDKKKKDIPEPVLECWNTMIAKQFSGSEATVFQDEIVAAIAEAMIVSKDYVYDQHWLDIEDIYRKAGWSVTYDKPISYAGESYRAHFIFRKKRNVRR